MSRRIFLALPLSVLLGACNYGPVDGNGGGNAGSSGASSSDVPVSTIDVDSTIAGVTPGQGAGAFVEYASGGTWHVTTACDTDVSSSSCAWDIYVGATNGIRSFSAENLEGNDWVDWGDQGSVHFVATTSNDTDGFHFEADPGATTRVDVYLDGAPAPRFIYWVGGGGLHRGAPSNPIDLTPSAD